MPYNEYLLVFGRSFFFALATLLPFLNPPAITPIFWTLTEGASSEPAPSCPSAWPSTWR